MNLRKKSRPSESLTRACHELFGQNGTILWSDVTITMPGRSATHGHDPCSVCAEENAQSVKTVDRVRDAFNMVGTSKAENKRLKAESVLGMPLESVSLRSGRPGVMLGVHHCHGEKAYVQPSQGLLWPQNQFRHPPLTSAESAPSHTCGSGSRTGDFDPGLLPPIVTPRFNDCKESNIYAHCPQFYG